MQSTHYIYPATDRALFSEDDVQYILQIINVSRKELSETIKLYRISAAAIASCLKRLSITGSYGNNTIIILPQPELLGKVI